MKIKNLNNILEDIFLNAKEGDCIGFLASGIKKLPIEIATGGACTHCGIIWNVKRKENEMTFNFSEQTFSGGKFGLNTIKKDDNSIKIDNKKFYESEKIYFKQLKEPLNDSQILLGKLDAKFEINKQYGYLSLIFGLEFLERILPNFIKKYISKYSSHKRVCSTHCAVQYKKIGLINYNKDFYFTPIEIMKLNIFK